MNAWRALQQCLEKAEERTGWHVNLVFLVYYDAMLTGKWKLVERAIERPWVGLHFLPFHFRDDVVMNRIKRNYLIKRDQMLAATANCRGLAVLDEVLYHLKASDLANGKPLFWLPDVTDRDLPEAAFDRIELISEKAAGRPIAALFGGLQPRKGVVSFLRTIQKTDPSQTFFVMIGHLSKRNYSRYRRELEKMEKRDNYYFEFRSISDDREFNALVKLSDILYLVYHKFYGSSGILGKAAVFRKMVIVTKGYCMEERVKRFKMGVTVDEGNVEQIVAAVKQLSHRDEYRRLLGQADFDGYCNIHQEEVLDKALHEMLSL